MVLLLQQGANECYLQLTGELKALLHVSWYVANPLIRIQGEMILTDMQIAAVGCRNVTVKNKVEPLGFYLLFFWHSVRVIALLLAIYY